MSENENFHDFLAKKIFIRFYFIRETFLKKSYVRTTSTPPLPHVRKRKKMLTLPPPKSLT